MFYYLFYYLDKTFDIPGVRLFNYISFRAILAFIIAMFIAMHFGKKIIRYLQQKQIGETIRDLGLEGQMSKKGTPTMGGVIIILSILVPCLLIGRIDNIYMALLLITTVWLGTLGFADDYIKVFKKNKEGLHGKFKIIAQIGLGLIIGLTFYFSPDVVIRENINKTTKNDIEIVEYAHKNEKSTKTTIPFVKNHNFDYADIFKFAGENAQTLGWIFFVMVAIFIVSAVSNGSNLTDGLDGLAAGSSAIIGVVLGIFAYLSSNINYASYLDIMYIPGSEELVIFASAFIGAIVGFLWYNTYPAQVFMGDTGSLTIGGIIAVFALAVHKELMIPIFCGIFLAESLSVIIQTSYFKYTKKRYGEGQRIFRMAPLHHHFQKSNIPETKIVIRFWLIGLLLAAITIITLKIR
ncbi:MAG: phospho-N-acetylmuramoyl-pentapeptide-transferase [Bacteroidales bacterium]|nr:phospho-N-acetylmuramoyl-pentapeptide-transferase [Bacteroidales bacterium]